MRKSAYLRTWHYRIHLGYIRQASKDSLVHKAMEPTILLQGNLLHCIRVSVRCISNSAATFIRGIINRFVNRSLSIFVVRFFWYKEIVQKYICRNCVQICADVRRTNTQGNITAMFSDKHQTEMFTIVGLLRSS